MGRMYSASTTGVAMNAAQDLFALIVPADKIVVVHEVRIGQITDAGDVEAEMLQVTIARYSGTVGSGGSTPTPALFDAGDKISGVTVRANDTTRAQTLTVLIEDVYNIQAGWLYLPTPETRIIIPGQGKLVVASPNVPADPITIATSIVFEEIG